VGALRSAIDELSGADLRRESDRELETELEEIERASRALEAQRLRRVAELDVRGAFARDGYLSMSAWLVHRTRVGWSAAGQHVRMARALRRMPRTREALAQGDVSTSAAAMLVAARESNKPEFKRVEATLVDAALALPVRELNHALAYWREAVDRCAAGEDGDRVRERRRLHVSPVLDGMVRVDGDLDPETGEHVVTALRAVLDAGARRRGDERSTPQRRADALGEICRQWLDSPDRPTVATEKPHVSVTLDLASLEGRAGTRCALDHAGRISAEDARRLACDAMVSRVVVGPRSQPLEAGRRTAVVPAPLRRALVVRDGGCRFPGCDRPPGWTDAHHVVHWADGGETSLDNLVLLCRPHHRLVHRRFGVRVDAGRPVFTRPDGSVLDDGAGS
jgi:hypothetical protein